MCEAATRRPVPLTPEMEIIAVGSGRFMTPPSHSTLTSSVRDLIGAEILVIEKDERVQRGMTQVLSAAKLHVTCTATPAEAFELLERNFYSVVVVDLDTPSEGAGLSTVHRVKQLSGTSMIVVLTGRRSFDEAVEVIRAGAIDVIFKSPESVQYLRDRIREAAGHSAGKREVHSLLAEVREAHEAFLKRYMDAERRALDLDDRLSGRDPDREAMPQDIRVLVASQDPQVYEACERAQRPRFSFEAATSGGEALDRCGSSRFDIVMVADDLPDLPESMVFRSLRTQNPELVMIAISPPGIGGSVQMVESERRETLIDNFKESTQLVARLDELADAFVAKARERRYIQAFREKNYDFLRRYVELKMKIDRAMSG
jgi:DNA-binding NtrC family response regulator